MPLDELMLPVPPGEARPSAAELVERLGEAARPDPALTANLPDAPGVYRFFDAGDTLLYVGKSLSIRKRVKSHFSARRRNHKELKLVVQTRRIECTETAGELGALLLENRDIKTRHPVYNARQRRAQHLLTYSLERNSSGFDVPTLTGEPLASGRWQREYYGLFRGRSSAQKTLGSLALEHELCKKLLGLEKGRGPCFNYQLKRCQGACAGRESADSHNQRLREALQSHAIEAWPYSGPIVIAERTDYHLVSHWSWLGSAESVEMAMALRGGTEAFDMDTYRILLRALRTNVGLSILQNL